MTNTSDTCNGCGTEYNRDDDGANIHYCPDCRELAEDASGVE